MSEKIRCEVCGQEFGQITCSHLKKHGLTMAQYRGMFPDTIVAVCSPERAARHSAFMLKYYLDEDNLQANSERVKKAWARGDFDKRSTPEYLRNHSVAMETAWADPDSRLNSDARRKKLSSSLKMFWAGDSKRRKSFSFLMRSVWARDNKKIRQKLSKAGKAAWAREDSGLREYWRNYTSISSGEYPSTFNEIFKQIIRGRDSKVCAICRLPEQNGDRLSVHHIDYIKENTTLENCVALCKSCHGVTNRNREYWQRELSDLVHTREASP